MQFVWAGRFFTVWEALFEGKKVILKELKDKESFFSEAKMLQKLKKDEIESHFVNMLGVVSQENWIILEEI